MKQCLKISPHPSVVLINVSNPSIGSRIPADHLPPLGLLSIGGPLIDAGCKVFLLDADLEAMTPDAIVSETVRRVPDIIMLGHSGSTTSHPITLDLCAELKHRMPQSLIVYGGVHPTYFWNRTLVEQPAIDIIVRGEGEATVVELIAALRAGLSLENVDGIAFRNKAGEPVATRAATFIRNLDHYRVGWELIDFSRYRYWGGHRAVVIQFSRGCPHQCTYCGQKGFWTRWRHRDPALLAKEIAWLHREHGVVVFNFADENLSTSKRIWKNFLEALIAENVPVRLVASMRADDVVRDADILHLYKKAGFERFLLGMEHTDEKTLHDIKKGGTIRNDYNAIRLLRKHGILSLATWVAGFGEETGMTMRRALEQLLVHDPDQIQTLFATPLPWTEFGRESLSRKLIQSDLSRWDYKHQILSNEYLKPWQLYLWIKFIEIVMQCRPKALARLLFHPDALIRQANRWYYRIGRKVWFYEIRQFLFHDKRNFNGRTLRDYWGNNLIEEEYVHRLDHDDNKRTA